MLKIKGDVSLCFRVMHRSSDCGRIVHMSLSTRCDRIVLCNDSFCKSPIKTLEPRRRGLHLARDAFFRCTQKASLAAFRRSAFSSKICGFCRVETGVPNNGADCAQFAAISFGNPLSPTPSRLLGRHRQALDG